MGTFIHDAFECPVYLNSGTVIEIEQPALQFIRRLRAHIHCLDSISGGHQNRKGLGRGLTSGVGDGNCWRLGCLSLSKFCQTLVCISSRGKTACSKATTAQMQTSASCGVPGRRYAHQISFNHSSAFQLQ